MPFTNVLAFSKCQAAIETTRGTAIAVMTRWLDVLSSGGIAMAYTRDREDAPETLRSFQADRDTTLLTETSGITIEAKLAYEMIPWWLSMALKGGAATRIGTTTGSTPPGYTYTIIPSDTTDDLDTFTLKIGDGATCYIFKRCAVNSMSIRCNPESEGSWRISLDIMAVFVGTGTFDAPTDISRTIVDALGSKLYVDTASAIGTTALTSLVRNFSITVVNGIEEKRFIDSGVAAANDFGRGYQRVTGDFTEEFVNDTRFALMRANTAVKLRHEKTGANIGATPTADYRVRVDIPQAKLNSPSWSYMGNNRVVTWSWIGEKPAGASSIQTATVIASTPVLA